ncbi:MAG: phage N-6-adenine-methyltransferase [Pirellulales bacterium]|nr:phage N-6-adenine-methyltransferase [Pirellulales bacterium]
MWRTQIYAICRRATIRKRCSKSATHTPIPEQLALFRADRNVPINRAMFSSRTDVWATPQDVFALLDAEFHFDLDVCALPANAKCRRYFTPKQDGLKQEWTGVCWMNPPYGREIGKWMKKALVASLKGATVVCLVPARCDTAWWHEYATRGEIRFIRGRLKFGSASSAAPFPSAIVIFRDRWWERSR